MGQLGKVLQVVGRIEKRKTMGKSHSGENMGSYGIGGRGGRVTSRKGVGI